MTQLEYFKKENTMFRVPLTAKSFKKIDCKNGIVSGYFVLKLRCIEHNPKIIQRSPFLYNKNSQWKMKK